MTRSHEVDDIRREHCWFTGIKGEEVQICDDLPSQYQRLMDGLNRTRPSVGVDLKQPAWHPLVHWAKLWKRSCFQGMEDKRQKSRLSQAVYLCHRCSIFSEDQEVTPYLRPCIPSSSHGHSNKHKQEWEEGKAGSTHGNPEIYHAEICLFLREKKILYDRRYMQHICLK